jgi:hypothetical protein
MKKAFKLIPILIAVTTLVGGLVPSPAEADRRRKEKRHHDVRHGHDRHYHSRGHKVRVLPHAHRRIVVRRNPYFYHRGVFYRPHGPDFVVVAAPIGAVVRVLPRGYVTLYLGSFPYYYANYTYYSWDREVSGYRVVEEPADADSGTAVPTDLFVYPKAGQNEEQVAKDRYECHRWAVSETGSDPSAGEPLTDAARAEYHRAMTACLEARSYAVK